MNIPELAQQAPPLPQDDANGIILSSRIRLARNINNIHFRRSLSNEEQQELVKSIQASCSTILPNDLVIDLEASEHEHKQALVERHLISPEIASAKRPAAAIISTDEDHSLMINEEDHVRLQVLRPGLNLDEALNDAIQLDQKIEQKVDWAVHPRFGYLTACPTNVGTGLRASVMLHLPGLAITKELHVAFRGLSRLHLAVRGSFGEGSDAVGSYYQVSNQRTLGQTEEAIIAEMNDVVGLLIDYEQMARAVLLDRHHLETTDRLGRALGLLTSAQLLTSNEVTEHVSTLHLGISLNLLNGMSHHDLHTLELRSKSAHLRITHPEASDSTTRKHLRAQTLQNGLKKLKAS